jgi:hypothetical protein
MRNPFLCHVCDSRGTVRIVPQPNWRLGLTDLAPREAQLAMLRAELRGVPYALPARAVLSVGAGAVVGLTLYQRAIAALGPGDVLGAAVLSAIAGLALMWGLFRLGVRTPDIHTAGARLADCRLCVCCGYDLENLKADADGCTVCPECAAAWDLRASGKPGETVAAIESGIDRG